MVSKKSSLFGGSTVTIKIPIKDSPIISVFSWSSKVCLKYSDTVLKRQAAVATTVAKHDDGAITLCISYSTLISYYSFCL